MAEALQGMWKTHLGADIQLMNMEWKVFLSTIAKRDFSIARAGWIGDYVDANTFCTCGEQMMDITTRGGPMPDMMNYWI